MTPRLLALIAAELEETAGAGTSGGATDSGYWKRIATAAEAITGFTSSANAGTLGYMRRAVLAFEDSAGVSLSSNNGEEAYIARLAHALESINGETNTGSWSYRVYLGVLDGGGSSPILTPGAAATPFPTTPTLQYHIHSQQPSITVDGSDRLTSCPDLQGLAALVAVSGSTAPKLMQDGLGRYFLRFNASEAAAVGAALNTVANRAYMAVMVGRLHHPNTTQAIVNPRWASYTDDSTNAAANGSIGYLRATVTSNSAAFLQGGSPAASTNATDCYKVIPGCQLQVMAVASRTTANGGTRLYLNNDTCDVAQQTTSVTGYAGLVIGGSAGAANTANITASATAYFDLYALAFWKGELSNTQADAVVAAAVTNYEIEQLDTNLVLEGDSITYGITTALPTSPANSGGLGSRISEPGAPWLPGNVRVINLGSSGAQVSTLVTRRDATNSVFDKGKYPGGAAKNKIAVQIGRNDMGTAGNLSSTAHYSNVVALLHTTTTGYLERGWTVDVMSNIATANTAVADAGDGQTTMQGRVAAFRALILTGTSANATFLSDLTAGSGQTFDGLVAVKPLHLVTVAGDSKFDTATDAADSASGYYDSDQTHLRVAGVDLMVSGGEQPNYGYGSIL